MPRTHASVALVPSVIAVALAWLGTAHALAVDSYGIDGRVYLLAASGAAVLVVLACELCWHVGAVAGLGVVAGLWWGSAEYVESVGPGGGWLQGFEYVIFAVPLAAAIVVVVGIVTCAAMGTCPPSAEHRSPGSVVL
ncbi:hypothetical protein EUA93_08950 [Nocardioides oleivorans]|uniref:Uncharacterized protein n=1 Tax=Nocardioides oleivorans TaxID=273676 RepID=A0A4Q2RYU8_9ACTN|nr:hypothetical protein [Nocardioides oleivorans]RYB94460.1 hypothetical protein EUA93_08950 [Nocardioides oleivorans]